MNFVGDFGAPNRVVELWPRQATDAPGCVPISCPSEKPQCNCKAGESCVIVQR
jgi:hypothetical protein